MLEIAEWLAVSVIFYMTYIGLGGFSAVLIARLSLSYHLGYIVLTPYCC